MPNAFVWFHNSSDKPNESVHFYETLLGWRRAEGPPGMVMFAGASGPFAAIGDGKGGLTGWIPYVEVEDVDLATRRAKELGAAIVAEKTKGPAGDYSIVRDPGGAAIALWRKAQ